MANSSVFSALIEVVNRASAPLRVIREDTTAVGAAAQRITAHLRGAGMVLRAAFGEAEHGGHEAAHALQGVAEAGTHVNKILHGTTEEAKRAGHEIEHAANARGYETIAAHLGLLHTRFGSVSMSAGAFGGSITELLPVLGGLGVAGSLGGVFETVNRAAESYSELSRNAAAAGTSLREFQQINFAASIADVPEDSIRTAGFKLNRAVADAATGRNKDAAGLFAHLHMPLRDAGGHLRSAIELLPELADAFQRTVDPALRARMAMALFGRAGEQLMPLLQLGGEEIKKLAGESDRYNFLPTKEQGEKLEDFHQSMLKLRAATDGFRDAVGTALAPALQPVVQQMADWVAHNRDWIAQDMRSHIESFGDTLKKTDWKGIGESFRGVGNAALWVNDNVVSVKTVLEALAVLKVIGWAAEFGRKMLDLAAAVNAATAAVGRFWASAALPGTIAVAGAYAGFRGAQKSGEEIARRGDKGEAPVMIDDFGNPVYAAPEGGPRVTASPALAWLARLLHDIGNPAAPSSGSPDPGWQVGAPTPLPRLYAPGGAAAPPPAPAPVAGEVNVNIKLDGLPDRSVVRTDSRGSVNASVSDVGRSNPALTLP